MKKKTVIIIIACALLATVIVLGTLGTQKRNRELDAVGNTLPVDALYHDWTITSDQTLRQARGSGDGEGDGRATYPPTAEP